MCYKLNYNWFSARYLRLMVWGGYPQHVTPVWIRATWSHDAKVPAWGWGWWVASRGSQTLCLLAFNYRVCSMPVFASRFLCWMSPELQHQMFSCSFMVTKSWMFDVFLRFSVGVIPICVGVVASFLRENGEFLVGQIIIFAGQIGGLNPDLRFVARPRTLAKLERAELGSFGEPSHDDWTSQVHDWNLCIYVCIYICDYMCIYLSLHIAYTLGDYMGIWGFDWWGCESKNIWSPVRKGLEGWMECIDLVQKNWWWNQKENLRYGSITILLPTQMMILATQVLIHICPTKTWAMALNQQMQ